MLEESTSGSNLSRKATLLMAEVLQMANRVLPLSIAAQIQVDMDGSVRLLWLIRLADYPSDILDGVGLR